MVVDSCMACPFSGDVGERDGDHWDSGFKAESVDDSGEFQIGGARAVAELVISLLVESAGGEERVVTQAAFFLELGEESGRDS